jgi:ZIP family zinc transporter
LLLLFGSHSGRSQAETPLIPLSKLSEPALIGNGALAEAGPATLAFVTAVAAGAILAMLADTMVPEAFETAHEYAGLITVAGFLAAFTLSRVVGA